MLRSAEFPWFCKKPRLPGKASPQRNIVISLEKARLCLLVIWVLFLIYFFSIHTGFVHVLLIWIPYRFPIHFDFCLYLPSYDFASWFWSCFSFHVFLKRTNFISKSWEGCSFLTGKFLDKRFSLEISVSKGEWTFCYWVCLPGIYIEYVC